MINGELNVDNFAYENACQTCRRQKAKTGSLNLLKKTRVTCS